MTRACNAFESRAVGSFCLCLFPSFLSLSLSLSPLRTRESRKNIRFEWRLKEYLKIIVVERALEIKLAREFYILKLGNFRSV